MRCNDRRLKYLLWLILAQTICVGAGIGIYHQTARSIISQYLDTLMAEVLAAPLLLGAGYTLVWSITMLTIVTYLLITRIFEEFGKTQNQSETDALRDVHSLLRTRDAIIFGLAKLAESRDDETGQHLDRMSAYASCLAGAASVHPRYHSEITEQFLELLRIGTPLHDIGKVGIPDRILLKPERLTPAEQKQMEGHAVIGAQCLLEIERRLGNSDFLQMARAIILCHHERWDGGGYPAGLSGEEIPLAARIAAIADVYDALSSDRVYRPALPHEECVAIIRQEAGGQFDPVLVEIFLKIEPNFREIASLYGSGCKADAEAPLLSLHGDCPDVRGGDASAATTDAALLRKWDCPLPPCERLPFLSTPPTAEENGPCSEICSNQPPLSKSS